MSAEDRTSSMDVSEIILMGGSVLQGGRRLARIQLKTNETPVGSIRSAIDAKNLLIQEGHQAVKLEHVP